MMQMNSGSAEQANKNTILKSCETEGEIPNQTRYLLAIVFWLQHSEPQFK